MLFDGGGYVVPLDIVVCPKKYKYPSNQKYYLFKKTRMTTFIKTKFKLSDDQTNIVKHRLAANITEYHVISKLILQRIIITHFCGPVSHLRKSTISDFEFPSNFRVKEEEKIIQIGS